MKRTKAFLGVILGATGAIALGVVVMTFWIAVLPRNPWLQLAALLGSILVGPLAYAIAADLRALAKPNTEQDQD